jgi:hypothetical protein
MNSACRIRRERADEKDPLRVIPDEMLEDALEKTILAARTDPELNGKLYLTEIFITMFGSLKHPKVREPKYKMSVIRRVHLIIAKRNYPLLVKTRYTTIWDVKECPVC